MGRHSLITDTALREIVRERAEELAMAGKAVSGWSVYKTGITASPNRIYAILRELVTAGMIPAPATGEYPLYLTSREPKFKPLTAVVVNEPPPRPHKPRRPVSRLARRLRHEYFAARRIRSWREEVRAS